MCRLLGIGDPPALPSVVLGNAATRPRSAYRTQVRDIDQTRVGPGLRTVARDTLALATVALGVVAVAVARFAAGTGGERIAHRYVLRRRRGHCGFVRV